MARSRAEILTEVRHRIIDEVFKPIAEEINVLYTTVPQLPSRRDLGIILKPLRAIVDKAPGGVTSVQDSEDMEWWIVGSVERKGRYLMSNKGAHVFFPDPEYPPRLYSINLGRSSFPHFEGKKKYMEILHIGTHEPKQVPLPEAFSDGSVTNVLIIPDGGYKITVLQEGVATRSFNIRRDGRVSQWKLLS